MVPPRNRRRGWRRLAGNSAHRPPASRRIIGYRIQWALLLWRRRKSGRTQRLRGALWATCEVARWLVAANFRGSYTRRQFCISLVGSSLSQRKYLSPVCGGGVVAATVQPYLASFPLPKTSESLEKQIPRRMIGSDRTVYPRSPVCAAGYPFAELCERPVPARRCTRF